MSDLWRRWLLHSECIAVTSCCCICILRSQQVRRLSSSQYQQHSNNYTHTNIQMSTELQQVQWTMPSYAGTQQQQQHTHNRFMTLLDLSGTTRVSQKQKCKSTKVTPIWIYWSKRKWVAVASARPYANLCTLPQTDNHISTSWCPSCHPTNSVKALKATCWYSK